MRLRQTIHLQPGDRARASAIDSVFGMIGGHDLPEAERKLFGRFRANEFTLDDVSSIQAIVARETAKPVPVIFFDAKLQDVWATGARQAQLLATRTMAAFVSDLEDDLAGLGARG